MNLELPAPLSPSADLALQTYLLGSVDFQAALAWQRRLVYQVGGDRSCAALILCEHPPLITVGREGSRAHIRCDSEELHARHWGVRWVNRGGGCLLQTPGQLAVYPILPLDRLGLGVQAYLDRLHQVVIEVLADFSVRGQARTNRAGIWVGGRLIAAFGIAVRDWVTYYGCVINVSPDLEGFRRLNCGGPGEGAMTSVERERHGPLRPSLFRQQFLEHFVNRFGFERMSIFFDHPALNKKAPSDAVAAGS